MVAPIITTPLDSGTVTTTAAYQFSASVPVYDVDSFSFEIRHLGNPGTNNALYKIQVSKDGSSWADWIAETTLTNGGSFAQSYPEESFRYLRVGVAWVTAGEDVAYSISTRREKVI